MIFLKPFLKALVFSTFSSFEKYSSTSKSCHSFGVRTLYDGLRNEIEQQIARHNIGIRFRHKDILSPGYFANVAMKPNKTAQSMNQRIHVLPKPALAHDVMTRARRSNCTCLFIAGVWRLMVYEIVDTHCC